MRTARAALALVVSLIAAAPLRAAKPETWTEAQSPHFHVVTNAKPKAAVHAVQKLEEFRHLLGLMFPGIRLDPPAPARVILFKNKKSFELYIPRATEKGGRLGGFMQPGAERMYLSIDLGSQEPQPVVFHEYIHLVLALNMGRVPTWLNEGLAEYYERTEIDKDKFVTGEYQLGWWEVLQTSKLMPLAVLVRRDYHTQPFKDEKEQSLFYAQSWLLVHYFMVADLGRYRPQLSQFLQLLLKGEDPDTAFARALGEYSTMDKRLRDYLMSNQRNTYGGKMLLTAPPAPVEFAPMHSAVAEAYLTDLWFNRGDVAQAEQALQALAQSGSPPPEVLDRLGRIALMHGKPVEAEKYLQAALAARPNDLGLAYYTAWAISQGRMGQAENEGERQAAASRVIELLSPHLGAISSFPHAYHLLIRARMARNDPPAELIPVVERARQLMPLEREFAFLLAHLYEREEKWEEAEKLLTETARRAEEGDERQRAEQMLDSLRRRREYTSRPQGPMQVLMEGDSSVPTGPPVNVRDPVEPPPAPAAPPEVRYIRGTLVDVRCADDAAVVTVSLERKAGEPARVVHLAVRSRARLILLDPSNSGRQLECGPADVPVAVNYRVEAAGETVGGVVMTIEFNLPPPPR
ncbi:MAG: tetratricopeptide repeat protein [Candidatus Acidiferrales bacterium]